MTSFSMLLNPFEQMINERLRLGKPTIGVGLKEPNIEIVKSLTKSKRYAKIVLVGPSAIKRVNDFQKVISKEPENTLTKMLFKGEVEGLVRGTIDDFKTREAYQALIGRKKYKKVIELTLMEDHHGRRFFLSQVSNPNGWTRTEKIKDCLGVIQFMRSELRIKPKIGCLTGIRHETFERKKGAQGTVQRILNQTYQDAEFVVNYFRTRNVQAKNYSIEIENALQDGCNIIVPPNGMVGNQIFRTLVLIGGGKLLACPLTNLPHPYEDNSRSETNFEQHIRWLAAWVNGQKFKK